jgi:hypothetical protein
MIEETKKAKKTCKNRGIPKTQLGFSLDQYKSKVFMVKLLPVLPNTLPRRAEPMAAIL